MGLFGSIFKAVGGIAKAGLGVLTHGASDKIFSVLKGKGAAKQVLNSPDVTQQQQALVNKLTPYVPRTKSTEQHTIAALQPLRARYMEGESPYRTYRAKKMPGRAKRKPALYHPVVSMRDANGLLPGQPGYSKKRARKPAKTRSGAKRGAPPGGLDLKRISQMWRAEGSPGVWQDYIRAHSDVRKS